MAQKKKRKAKPWEMPAVTFDAAADYELDVWRSLDGAPLWRWSLRCHHGLSTKSLATGAERASWSAQCEAEMAALELGLRVNERIPGSSGSRWSLKPDLASA